MQETFSVTAVQVTETGQHGQLPHVTEHDGGTMEAVPRQLAAA